MKVSVIIPVYNAAKFVRLACESALMQPETGEVILVEDGSTDNTPDVCRELESADGRVKLLRHPDGRNHGISATRNLGVQSSRYEYLGFIDADDRMLPGRFSAACDILDHDLSVDAVYEAIVAEFENDAAKQRWDKERGSRITTMIRRVDPEDLFESLVQADNGCFSTDGIVVRKQLFERTGLFDVKLPVREDTAMWLKMSAIGRLVPGRLEEPVAVRRVHAANRSVAANRRFGRALHQMWYTVFKWSLAVEVSPSRRNLLLREWLECSERYWFKTGSWRLRKLCGLLRLPVEVARCPRIAGMAGLREYAGDAVGNVLGREKVT